MEGMVQIPEELRSVLSVDPEIMSGAVCFIGTRVPVQALFDTLRHGVAVSEFLEDFPAVPEEKALAVVRWEQMEARRYFGIAA